MSYAKLLFVAAFLCLWALPTHSQVSDGGYTVGDIISDFAEELGFDRFRDSLNSYSLIEQLRVEENPVTVFALDDESWDQNQNQIDTLGGRNQLEDFLKNLIVDGEYSADNFTNDQILYTNLEGGWLRVNTYPNGTFLNGALRLVDEINNATNGIIHTIRGFLLPTTSTFGDVDQTISSYLDGNDRYSTFISVLDQIGLYDILDGQDLSSENAYTLFAPSNDAFTNSGIDIALLTAPQNAAALRDLLLNHIVQGTYFLVGLDDGAELQTLLPGSSLTVSEDGGVVAVNNISVTNERVKRNGVIHDIEVLLFPDGFTLVGGEPIPTPEEPVPSPEQQEPEPEPEPVPVPTPEPEQPEPEVQPEPETEPEPVQPEPEPEQPEPEVQPEPEPVQPEPEFEPQPDFEPQPEDEQPEPQPEEEQPEPQPEEEQPEPQPPAGNATFCYQINSCDECQKHPNDCSYCSIPPTDTQPYRGRCVPKPVSVTNQQTCTRLGGAYLSQGQCPHVKQPCTSYTTCAGCVAEPQCFYCSYGHRRGCYSKSSTQDVQTCLSVGKLINDNCPFA